MKEHPMRLPSTSRLLRAAPALLAVLSGLVFLGVQLRLPTPRGADAAYYLLGSEHLAAGRWAWGSEPPLAFLVFLPFAKLLSGPLSFVAASAAWGAATVYVLGLLAQDMMYGARTTAAATAGPAAAGVATAGAWGSALGFGYMFFCFVSGLFKNAVANVFMILALRQLCRRRWGSSALFVLLAALSHPGAAATLLVAAGFAGPIAAAQWMAGKPRPGPGLRPPDNANGGSGDNAPNVGLGPAPPGTAVSGSRSRRNLTIAFAGVAALAVGAGLILGRSVLPTFLRYLGTYLGRTGQVRPPAVDVFTWDSLSLFCRYLPLWPIAAAQLGRPGVPGQPGSGLVGLTMGCWIGVLVGMASLGGLTARRFEIQLFIPLVALAAVCLATSGESLPQWVPGPVRTATRVLAVLALVFGLVLQGGTIATSSPLLDAAQVGALRELDTELPADAVLCVFMTDVRYWAEYFARRPVLAADLLRERMGTPGPVYVLTQNPTAYFTPWPPATVDRLRAQGVIVWEREGFMLLRARRDPEFLAGWLTPADNDTVIQLIDTEVLAPDQLPGYSPPRPHRLDAVVGWLLFAPLGLARLAGLGPAPALALGLPATAVMWFGLWHMALGRRRSGEIAGWRSGGRPRGSSRRPAAS
ncbi:MAG: hypothetical protein Q8P31_04340 [Bacillota bacterium]|nr:hypothetical protein [Bacillota bacterium]